MLGDTGKPLDAHFRIKRAESPSEVTISFESAGGTDRNQDFSTGFEALLGCLAQSNAVIREIRKGEAEKRLTLPFPLRLTSASDARKTRLRITGTEGRQGEGFSTSSVARLDIDLEADPSTSLLETLARASTPAGRDNAPHSTRSARRRAYAIEEIKSLTPASVEKALDRIDLDGIEPHGRNTTYAVVARGRQYPPLAVAAFAIEADDHDPVPAGGLRGERDSPAFRLLLDAGYEIVRVDERGDEQARLLRETDRGQRPPAAEVGSRKPRVTTRTSVEYKRDPWVVRLVLERAKGVCESCEAPAPFSRRSGGEPYLEVHHVVPLSEDGPDTVDNAVAICPNCHARCHQGEDHQEFNGALYGKVAGLAKPSG